MIVELVVFMYGFVSNIDIFKKYRNFWVKLVWKVYILLFVGVNKGRFGVLGLV